MIGSSTQADIIETGTSTLTSLLGGTTTSALTTAIAKYAGIGDSGSKSLLGLLGPVVMGVLAKQQRAAGLDASGLANLLTSQKDNIVSTLPTGFSKYLGGSGILDNLVGSSAARGASAADVPPISSRPSYTAPPKRDLLPHAILGLAHPGGGGTCYRRPRLALAITPKLNGIGCEPFSGED